MRLVHFDLVSTIETKPLRVCSSNYDEDERYLFFGSDVKGQGHGQILGYTG